MKIAKRGGFTMKNYKTWWFYHEQGQKVVDSPGEVLSNMIFSRWNGVDHFQSHIIYWSNIGM